VLVGEVGVSGGWVRGRLGRLVGVCVRPPPWADVVFDCQILARVDPSFGSTSADDCRLWMLAFTWYALNSRGDRPGRGSGVKKGRALCESKVS
jgi:hypothetical protein